MSLMKLLPHLSHIRDMNISQISRVLRIHSLTIYIIVIYFISNLGLFKGEAEANPH